MPAEAFALPNVYGLIRRPDHSAMLIQRRWKPETDPDNLGKWELPGGKWRADESAEECLHRELLEECGIRPGPAGAAFARYEHLGQRVEASTPTLVVKGELSALLIYSGYSDEEPIAEGDGSRDAQFMALGPLKDALQQQPDTFTALTFSALSELVSRGLL